MGRAHGGRVRGERERVSPLYLPYHRAWQWPQRPTPPHRGPQGRKAAPRRSSERQGLSLWLHSNARGQQIAKAYSAKKARPALLVTCEVRPRHLLNGVWILEPTASERHRCRCRATHPTSSAVASFSPGAAARPRLCFLRPVAVFRPAGRQPPLWAAEKPRGAGKGGRRRRYTKGKEPTLLQAIRQCIRLPLPRPAAR